MDYLLQKVAYLQGLSEGLGVDDTSKEGKLLLGIIDTLEEFADVLDEIIENQMDIEDYVEFIDEDLSEVEEVIFGEDDEFDIDDFDFDDLDDCCDDDTCECYFEDDEE